MYRQKLPSEKLASIAVRDDSCGEDSLSCMPKYCVWKVAKTDTSCRTILSSPVHHYSVLTAARGYLSPFRLPRYIGWDCSHSLAVQAHKCVFKSTSMTPKALSVSRTTWIAPSDCFDADERTTSPYCTIQQPTYSSISPICVPPLHIIDVVDGCNAGGCNRWPIVPASTGAELAPGKGTRSSIW